MTDRNKKPELLKEGFFTNLFQLHFLQQMFGGGVEGWDPDQEEFLQAQEQLPALKQLLDAHDGSQEDCARDPKCRSKLGKIMMGMPDSVNDAVAGEFAKDAVDQLSQAEEALIVLVGSIADVPELMMNKEPFKGMDSENKAKVLQLYSKIAEPSIKQLGTYWSKMLETIEGNKEASEDVRKMVDAGKFIGEVEAQMKKLQAAGSGLKEFVQNQDLGNWGPVGGPRQAGTRASDDVNVLGLYEDDTGGTGNWEQEVFGEVSIAMEELETEFKTLQGYMTAEDFKSPFGLDKEGSSMYLGAISKTINSIDSALFQRLPRMMHRAVGTGDRSPSKGAPNFDPSKMDKQEKIQKTRELITKIEQFKKDGDSEKLQQALEMVATIDQGIAKQVAQKYNIKLNEGVIFYESFGDFS